MVAQILVERQVAHTLQQHTTMMPHLMNMVNIINSGEQLHNFDVF